MFRHAYYAKRKQIYLPANRFTFLTIWLLIWCISLTHHLEIQNVFFFLKNFVCFGSIFACRGFYICCRRQVWVAGEHCQESQDRTLLFGFFRYFHFLLLSFSAFLTFFKVFLAMECTTRGALIAYSFSLFLFFIFLSAFIEPLLRLCLISSDRSSYSDDVLVYIQWQPTFWDFEH